MKKKRRLVLGWLLVISIFAGLAVSYAAIGMYYQGSFYPGTYANGIYCTGRTLEEVNTELKDKYDENMVFLYDDTGSSIEFTLSDIEFAVDYTSQLDELQNLSNPFLWISAMSRASHSSLQPMITFDEALLQDKLSAGVFDKVNDTKDDGVGLVEIRRDGCYILYDSTKHLLDRELLFKKVREALLSEQYSIDFTDCYVDLPYTETQQETFLIWEQVEKFQTCGITYDMGDTKIALTPDIVSAWITLNKDGSFVFDETGYLIPDETAMDAFVNKLCDEYDTLGSTRAFLSTRGDIITIEGGTYGNKLDREAELAYLKEAFQKEACELHVPAYEVEAYAKGKNDIGDTYIEVDMTEQKLYFYNAGELALETDVVTGNTGRRMGTPEGVNFIYSMQRNRTLRGPGYATPVKYWMPVKGNVGIHDASWRKEFGGEIYKKNGSHGCINVPPDKMAELYKMVEIGIPVVMFY